MPKEETIFFRHSCFMRRCFYTLVLLVLGSVLQAQVIDSLAQALRKRPGLTGGFSTKWTFIDGFTSPIYTGRIGLNYDHWVRMGLGFSQLKLSPYESGADNRPFYIDQPVIDASGEHVVPARLNLFYGILFAEVIYHRTRRWQFSSQIILGAGSSDYRYTWTGEKFRVNRHFILLYEPAISGQYKVFPWFGAGIDVGYRLMIINNPEIGSRFNSPVYDLKMIIFWGELFKLVRKV